MAVFFLVLATILSHASAQRDACKWTVMNEGTAYELDLRPLYNVTLGYFYSYYYLYSPCNNGEFCNNDGQELNAMAIQYDNSSENEQCFIIGNWDGGSVYTPEYLPESNEFVIPYENGDDCFGAPRYFSPIFHCDPTVDYNVVAVGENRTCELYMVIHSKYACPNTSFTTTTTAIPENRCVWTTNDGEHTLNLTSIEGNVYMGLNSNDNQQSFTVSPCSNNVLCGIEQAAMSTIINNQNFQCLKYLALWDGGVTQPNYSPTREEWQFIYTNGEGCDGLGITYNVYYVCDNYDGDATITAAREISQCNFEIYIASKFACD